MSIGYVILMATVLAAQSFSGTATSSLRQPVRRVSRSGGDLSAMRSPSNVALSSASLDDNLSTVRMSEEDWTVRLNDDELSSSAARDRLRNFDYAIRSPLDVYDDDVAEWGRGPPVPVRRSEAATVEKSFRKTTSPMATTKATEVAAKTPEFNKKHPSNEYQVYSPPATDAASVLTPSAACGEMTTPTPTPTAKPTARAGDNQVVGDIIEQLKDMGQSPSAGEAVALAECSRDGSWYSEAGGVRLDIVTNANTLHVQVVETVPRREGVLACRGWNVTGWLPFDEPQAPFVLIGVNDLEKVVAAFVGQCLVCEGHELVLGKWLVVEEARDCVSMVSETVEVPEVFRRERLHALKAQRLERLNLTECFPSTERHTTTTKMPLLSHRKEARKGRRVRRDARGRGVV